MDIAANKAVAARYFELASSGDLGSTLALFSEDASWEVPGSWELARTYRGDDLRDLLASLSQFKGGLRFRHHSVTAEEDRVVIQTTVEGDLEDGRHYTNEIIFIFVIREGRIVRITEAPDSAKSRQFWLGKS